jgi:hypothetical protein
MAIYMGLILNNEILRQAGSTADGVEWLVVTKDL